MDTFNLKILILSVHTGENVVASRPRQIHFHSLYQSLRIYPRRTQRLEQLAIAKIPCYGVKSAWYFNTPSILHSMKIIFANSYIKIVEARAERAMHYFKRVNIERASEQISDSSIRRFQQATCVTLPGSFCMELDSFFLFTN